MPPTCPPTSSVLAAVERAARHQTQRTRRGPRVVGPRTPGRSRALRRRAPRARSAWSTMPPPACSSARSRHGVPTWELTSSGRSLRRARSAGELCRRCRSRRSTGRGATRAAPPPRSSSASARACARACSGPSCCSTPSARRTRMPWLELAQELQRSCRRVASASHCLYQWSEPDDEHADVDEPLRAGRRGARRGERARGRPDAGRPQPAAVGRCPLVYDEAFEEWQIELHGRPRDLPDRRQRAAGGADPRHAQLLSHWQSVGDRAGTRVTRSSRPT